jgi:glucans biosynthesis protein
VDFAGAGTGLVPDLSATDGAVLSGTAIFALPEGRGTRVTFLLAPEARDSVDLRLVLRDDGGTQRSPVWLYRWTRARDGGA